MDTPGMSVPASNRRFYKHILLLGEGEWLLRFQHLLLISIPSWLTRYPRMESLEVNGQESIVLVLRVVSLRLTTIQLAYVVDIQTHIIKDSLIKAMLYVSREGAVYG